MAGLRSDGPLIQPSNTDFLVRWGRRADCAEIMRLVSELAEFERAPAGSVSVTREILERDGFPTPADKGSGTTEPVFRVLAVTAADSAVVKGDEVLERLEAFALFFTAYSTWQGRFMYLEDLYVVPEHRGKGIGQCLLRNLAQMCVDQGLPRLRWQVLDWNEPAREFYKCIGATELSEWLTCQMGVDSLSRFTKAKSDE